MRDPTYIIEPLRPEGHQQGEREYASSVSTEVRPSDIQGWCDAAMPDALSMTLEMLGRDLQKEAGIYLLAAAATLNGFITIGRILPGFADSEFTCVCPAIACGRQLFVWPERGRLAVAADDPVFHPETERLPVRPGPVSGPHLAAYQWLVGIEVAGALAPVVAMLPGLFGTGVCPSCKAAFSIMDALVSEQS